MNTPIVDFVKRYADSNALRMHMPGHKGVEFLGCEKYDITEISGADVLYSADGIIAESQKNAEKLFNTKATFYSTEGSSLCIRAMLYLIKAYAVQNEKKPLVAAGRNAHKTFVTAAALLDVNVDWLMDDSTNSLISGVINPNFVDKYLHTAQEKPIALYVTSPDYLGNIADIKSLSEVCHKHDVLLIVDNAHGAYLKFLPKDIHPISLGADICCDSAHKTLPVLTGGAYLHIAKTAPDFLVDNAKKALDVFASTSPSYLILQSLDMANKYLSENYCADLSFFEKEVKELKCFLAQKGYTLCGDEPLKITLATKGYGYTGCDLSDILFSQNIVCEFADPDYIVFMLTPQITKEELNRLKSALCAIKQSDPIKKLPPVPRTSKTKISLADALFAQTKKLKINDCIGEISASIDVACPPAIPIILPGEIISENTIECFKYYGITEWHVVK